MSNTATGAAFRSRYVTNAVRHTKPGPTLLADYLAGFRSRGQGAWPSQAHMATRFGVTVRTIQRWIDQLAAAGLLLVERFKPRQDHITGRWRRRTNRYRTAFRKTKRAQIRGKDQVTPTRHFCRVEDLFEEPRDSAAPESAVTTRSEPPELAISPPWEGTGLTAAQWTRRMMVEA